MGTIEPFGADSKQGETGFYGAQTLVGPAWPHVDENHLNDIGNGYMNLSDYLDGEVIPGHATQRQQLADSWDGDAGRAAQEAANRVLQAHTAAQKAALKAAWALFNAEAAVARTKHAVNQNAEAVDINCQIFMKVARAMLTAGCAAAQKGDSASAATFFNSAATFAGLIPKTIAQGLTENTAAVAACATGLAHDIGVPPSVPGADGKMPPPPPPSSVLPGGGVSGPLGGVGGPVSGGGGRGLGNQDSGSQTTPNQSGSQAGDAGENRGLGNQDIDSQHVPPPPTGPQAGGPGGNRGLGNQDIDSQHVPPPPGPAAGGPNGPSGPGPGGNRTPGTTTPMTGTPSGSPGTPAASTPGAPSGSPGGSQGAPGGFPGGQPAGPGQGQPGGPPGGPQGPQPPTGPQAPQPLAPAASSGTSAQPLAAAQAATPATTGAPAAGAGGPSAGTAPVSAAGTAPAASAPVGAPVTAAPTPAAPLGAPPTPTPAAPTAPTGAGGPAGPGVAPMSTNQQSQGAAAAPIPVTSARAEKDAMAAAARGQSVQRPRNTDADVETAVRIAAALHAPPSIPEGAWQFTWAVGVTTEGQILAANSYGVGFIPDKVHLPSQVTLVSADDRIPAGERGRWVRYPFVALQGWAAFHDKTLRVIVGTEDELQPYAGSTNTRTLVDEDIPADGTMKGRNRFEVIAPQIAQRLASWPDTELVDMLPAQPVKLEAPDLKAGEKLWLMSMAPLMQTTGENYRPHHLAALETYARHREAVALYQAYTAPFATAQRDAVTDWLYWGHFAAILVDAQNPALGG